MNSSSIELGDYLESLNTYVRVVSYGKFIGFDVTRVTADPEAIPSNISVREAKLIIDDLTKAVEAIEGSK
ncbi:hypothetical protein ACR6C2_16665 [Streptomyces sp. INA 01156]